MSYRSSHRSKFPWRCVAIALILSVVMVAPALAAGPKSFSLVAAQLSAARTRIPVDQGAFAPMLRLFQQILLGLAVPLTPGPEALSVTGDGRADPCADQPTKGTVPVVASHLGYDSAVGDAGGAVGQDKENTNCDG